MARAKIPESLKITMDVRIFCVHGVGHQEANPNFENDWPFAIGAGITQWNPGFTAQIQFVKYDELFASARLVPQNRPIRHGGGGV